MIKVVGGVYRSRVLKTPNNGTEPTKSMVRGAIASSLSDIIPGAQVLDLFGGSGAMGIEMLSHGASGCLFCDLGKEASQVIKDNLAMLKEEHGQVMNVDYRTCLKLAMGENRKFDIVILDPPYAMKESYQECLDSLFEGNLLTPSAAVVLEFEGDIEIDLSPFSWSKRYNYGRTNVIIARREK